MQGLTVPNNLTIYRLGSGVSSAAGLRAAGRDFPPHIVWQRTAMHLMSRVVNNARGCHWLLLACVRQGHALSMEKVFERRLHCLGYIFSSARQS
jgi:hypothetical protein